MARRGSVHLLLQHPLVGGADRVLRAAEDLRAGTLGLPEANSATAWQIRRSMRSVRTRPRPRLRPRATPSRRRRRRRPCGRSRSARDAAERDHAGNPAASADDHPAADLLAQDAVRRADIGAASGVTVAAFRPRPCSRIAGHASCTTWFFVTQRPSSERSKRGKLELEADHVRREDTQRLVEQLLAGLVALEDDDRAADPSAADDTRDDRAESGRNAKGGVEPRKDERALPLPRRARRGGSTRRRKVERIEQLGSRRVEGHLDLAEGGREAAGDRVDKAGRRQYLYHPEFRARQEQAKYDKLDAVRRGAARSAGDDGRAHDGRPVDRERVCAVAIRLINLAWFRVGSDRYAKTSRTYGVTTLTQASRRRARQRA